jgi:hypothetical protein
VAKTLEHLTFEEALGLIERRVDMRILSSHSDSAGSARAHYSVPVAFGGSTVEGQRI